MIRWTECCFVILVWIANHCFSNEVVWAVNCGGQAHKDINGVEYMTDLVSKGIASNYGASFVIDRVPMEDQILYQTERYNMDDLSYEVPLLDDGDYVLTLKFSEVWFTEPGQKVFDVKLNDAITLIENLDIFSQVGLATALDFHIPIKKLAGTLQVGDETIPITQTFTVDFIKSDRDNPKVNAIVLTKGFVADVPQLPPPQRQSLNEQKKRHVEEEEQEDSDPGSSARRRPAGKPRVVDPYLSTDYSNWIFPVLASLAAAIPVLFCLCRL